VRAAQPCRSAYIRVCLCVVRMHVVDEFSLSTIVPHACVIYDHSGWSRKDLFPGPWYVSLCFETNECSTPKFHVWQLKEKRGGPRGERSTIARDENATKKKPHSILVEVPYVEIWDYIGSFSAVRTSFQVEQMPVEQPCFLCFQAVDIETSRRYRSTT
jgi:hypothetical protein